MKTRVGIWIFSLIAVFTLSACSMKGNKLEIITAKMAKGVNEKLFPVEITNKFNYGTTKIYCWFQWRNAGTDGTVRASWYFATDNVHIIDYSFNIPRKEGFGSVSLTMPEGKNLPSGDYRVNLYNDGRLLKTLAFRVLEK